MLQAGQRKRDIGSYSENDKQAIGGCVSVYIVGERNKIINCPEEILKICVKTSPSKGI
jgi:hypothetical protein